jgi:hypothetical protein
MHLTESDESNFVYNYKNDIYIFVQLSEKFFYEFVEELHFMKPDPILSTILFGQFGQIIAENIMTFEYHINRKIFLHIEDMLNRKDEFLSTIVVTGLLEGMVSSLKNDDDAKKKIEFFLGAETKKYFEKII